MANTKQTILDVDGMSCSSCVRHVEGALCELDGIGKVEVKLKDGKVVVQHDPARATIDQMVAALSAAGRARVLTARGVVEQYGKVVVPLRENIVRFSQEQYDAMLLGVYQLIAAKQSEFAAYREYIEALRDYWIARSDLERAVGGRIGAPPPVVNHPAAAVAPPSVHAH